MAQFVIAGLVLGGIYAISASALVATFRSAGILNLAFGGMAYFLARGFYYLDTQRGWDTLPAAVLVIGVASPLLGLFLYSVLFRFLALATQLTKVVATLGLAVALPPLADFAFGHVTIVTVPGLAPQPVAVYHVAGVPITADQLIVYAVVAVLLVVGGLVLRFTEVGLRVRSTVDSPAMTSLSGTNPRAVAAGVWATATFLAGLVGVLAAPMTGLSPNDFTFLMAAAFAAVVAARLQSLAVANGVGFAMGITGALVLRYLPTDSAWTAAILPSIPFVFTAFFLALSLARRRLVNESQGVGGALDRAITAQGAASGLRKTGAAVSTRSRVVLALAFALFAALLPYSLLDFWATLIAQGTAFAVVFLSFTLITGEGGMIWLCQITFAGVGALTTAQLATNHGWPPLLALIAGGLVTVPLGLVVGALTIRLGPLYVALVTLIIGILFERLVFVRQIFFNNGLGVDIARPSFAADDRAFTVFVVVVFCVVALFLLNLRNSTTGLALKAVRGSETGARTIGIGVLSSKLLVAGVAAFVAGVGGGLLAMSSLVARPSEFYTLTGVVWFATLVTAGVRSIGAAYVAGLTFTLAPAAVQLYLPTWTSPIPTILFGLGAVYIAKRPEGWLPETYRHVGGLAVRIGSLRGRTRGVDRPSTGVVATPAEAAQRPGGKV